MRFFLLLLSVAAFGQATKFEPPRQADGHSDLQRVWRNDAIVAAFNVEGQEAFYNEPGGKSVIVEPPDGKLPYLPAARKQANDNHVHRERDPTGHCSPHPKNYRSWDGDSEDPKVFTRPCRIRMPLRLQKGIQIVEDECEEGE